VYALFPPADLAPSPGQSRVIREAENPHNGPSLGCYRARGDGERARADAASLSRDLSDKFIGDSTEIRAGVEIPRAYRISISFYVCADDPAV
jgi:hypothetical protein